MHGAFLEWSLHSEPISFHTGSHFHCLDSVPNFGIFGLGAAERTTDLVNSQPSSIFNLFLNLSLPEGWTDRISPFR